MVRRWCNYVCAEWSGARSHDCGNIPGTLGLHKESTHVGRRARTEIVLSRRAWLVSRSGQKNGKSAMCEPRTLHMAVWSRPTHRHAGTSRCRHKQGGALSQLSLGHAWRAEPVSGRDRGRTSCNGCRTFSARAQAASGGAAGGVGPTQPSRTSQGRRAS